MDIWKDLGISSNNSNEHKCFEKAKLLVMSASGIIEKEFPFETINDDTYVGTDSMMPMEYITHSTAKYTPFHWLDWTKGARVRFDSGEMVLKDFAFVRNKDKALSDNNGIVGVNLYF